MKRHESILVYGVTGLLLLILFVAIVFGHDGEAAPPEETVAKAPAKSADAKDPALELAEWMNLDPSAALRDAEAAERSSSESAENPATPAGEGSSAADAGAADGEQPGAEDAAGAPASPAAYERVGDYRKVTVERGDTFSLLVQRWCGSLDQLPVVEALNEDVRPDDLRPGRVLLMPWVDEAELADAALERRIVSSKQDAREAAAAAEGRVYELQKGDNLWAIAVRATGSQQTAPDYIRRIQELNPDLEPDRLVVGVTIRLP